MHFCNELKRTGIILLVAVQFFAARVQMHTISPMYVSEPCFQMRLEREVPCVCYNACVGT